MDAWNNLALKLQLRNITLMQSQEDLIWEVVSLNPGAGKNIFFSKFTVAVVKQIQLLFFERNITLLCFYGCRARQQ